MALRRIPLDPYPDTTQQCDLDGVTYAFRFRWSTRGACWHMDLHTVDNTPIVTSVRLVSGWPLLRRVRSSLRPPGELFMIDTTGQDQDPTLEEFGTRYGLFYLEASGIDG
jgi:hypothetical protein